MSLILFLKSNIQIEYIGKFVRDYLANSDREKQVLLLSTHSKSHAAFRLAYLNLHVAHSKGQGQGHAHFDYEYSANSDR